MKKIERSVNVGIELAPQEVAELFISMDSVEQAHFLNRLASEDFWPMQLQYLTDNSNLSDEARALMDMIGNYASKSARS